MKKILIVLTYFILLGTIYAQDTFSGKYYADNQAEYDTEKRWLEITRNKYQELVINSTSYTNAVAYYDQDNKTLYYVIEKPAQFNTFMKIQIIDDKTIELYMLSSNRWIKSSFKFKKQE